MANAGTRAGETVVQVYAGPAEPGPEQPRKRLCGFQRVELGAGETRRVALEIALKDLASFEGGAWRLDAGPWALHVGGSSAAAELVSIRLELPERTWSLRER